jgi:hypothetical protein
MQMDSEVLQQRTSLRLAPLQRKLTIAEPLWLLVSHKEGAMIIPVWIQLVLCIGAAAGLICDAILIAYHLWHLFHG